VPGCRRAGGWRRKPGRRRRGRARPSGHLPLDEAQERVDLVLVVAALPVRRLGESHSAHLLRSEPASGRCRAGFAGDGPRLGQLTFQVGDALFGVVGVQ
jgi:hypothetical protein